MISYDLSVVIVDKPAEAPKYDKDVRPLKLKVAIIVGKGTQNGQPTVDIQMVDKDGNKYIVMTTGALVEGLASAIVGKKEFDNNTTKNVH